MSLLRSASFLALASLALSANADVLVQYAFPSSDPATPSTVSASIMASKISSPLSVVYNPTNVPGGIAVPYSVTTPAQSLASNAYFAFTVAPEAGASMSLSDLMFDAAKGGASDPRGVFLRSSLDGYASNLLSTLLSTVQPTLATYTAPLGDRAFKSLTGPVTFRIYGYVQDETSGQALYYDNVTVNGSVQAVPEPAAFAVLALGVAGLLRRRKRA